jgi:hypothetical protein
MSGFEGMSDILVRYPSYLHSLPPMPFLVCRKLAETARFLAPGTLVTQDLMSHIDFRPRIRLGPTRTPEDRRSTATAAGSPCDPR